MLDGSLWFIIGFATIAAAAVIARVVIVRRREAERTHDPRNDIYPMF